MSELEEYKKYIKLIEQYPEIKEFIDNLVPELTKLFEILYKVFESIIDVIFEIYQSFVSSFSKEEIQFLLENLKEKKENKI